VGAAWAIDNKLYNDATPIHADYTSITQLSLRQAFAGVEITIPKASDGGYNTRYLKPPTSSILANNTYLPTSDVKVFMKEISSDGNVNTVDVIFPAWPVFLYLNPDMGRRLLEPVLQYQQSGLYPNKWSVHDIGANYPNATGHNDGKDESMPVEGMFGCYVLRDAWANGLRFTESGNMIIMALSYTRATKDNSLIANNYNLLTQWTQFLVNDSLIPAEQWVFFHFHSVKVTDPCNIIGCQATTLPAILLTRPTLLLRLVTNLQVGNIRGLYGYLQGIVGIRAMSEIATLLGKTDDAKRYGV
jgi:hypothetical protein